MRRARKISRLPALQRILTSRRVEPLIATVLRASPVRGRLRFLLRELRPPAKPRTYGLRDSPGKIVVRHGTPDLAALGEVFYEHQYDPPSAVERYLASLGRPPAILDLGANVGYFAVFASGHFPGARITAFEPDPANAAVLRQAADLNGWDWELVEAAARPDDGVIFFATGRFTYSREEEGGTAVNALDVMPFLDACDFAKVDIEGGEWAILADERFPQVAPPAIVLEHHPYRSPGDDPRAAALGLLTRADYEILRSIDLGRDQGLIWGLRRTPQSRPAA